MDFSLNDDHAMIANELDKLAARFQAKPTEAEGFVLEGPELEQELENSQYFDIAAIPEMGPVSAALAVERLAKLPYTAEIALSMLVRPQLDIELLKEVFVFAESVMSCQGREDEVFRADGASSMIA